MSGVRESGNPNWCGGWGSASRPCSNFWTIWCRTAWSSGRLTPEYRRGKLIVFTAAGRKLLADFNRVKRAIEARYREVLGPKRFAEFMAMLDSSTGGHEVPWRFRLP